MGMGIGWEGLIPLEWRPQCWLRV